jgi:4-amino-4-deoxy-L-arabinose transferase-like glycosyltransferase
MRHKIILGGIVAACAYLTFYNLDQTHFWDDEAQVGIMGRNLLASGDITGWDCRNLFAYRNGRALDEALRPRTPPLDYIVTASSFHVFGVSTFSGRVPYAIAGILALVVFALLLADFAPDEAALQYYAMCLLGLSPLFVLNIRQCRYNALCLLLSLLVFYGFRRYFGTRLMRWLLLMVVSSVLLFYAHFLICGAFLLGLVVLFVAFYRKGADRRDWWLLLLSSGVFLLLTVPYAVTFRVWCRPDMSFDVDHVDRGKLIWWNIRDLNLMGCLPWSIAVGLLLYLWRMRSNTHARAATEWLVLGVTNALFIGLLSPQPTTVETSADLRYLVTTIPALTAVTGYAVWFVHQRNAYLGVVLTVVLLFCNALTLAPFQCRVMLLLPAYLREIHNPYPTAFGEAVRFLESHANADDVVYAFPEYNAYPLMFYTGDRVRFGCLLNHKSPLSEQVIRRLDAPLYIDEHFPNWVIAFGYSGSIDDRLRYFSRAHEHNGVRKQFRYSLREDLGVFCYETHRPELNWHSFGPVTMFDHKRESVFVFERSAVLENADGTGK